MILLRFLDAELARLLPLSNVACRGNVASPLQIKTALLRRRDFFINSRAGFSFAKVPVRPFNTKAMRRCMISGRDDSSLTKDRAYASFKPALYESWAVLRALIVAVAVAVYRASWLTGTKMERRRQRSRLSSSDYVRQKLGEILEKP